MSREVANHVIENLPPLTGPWHNNTAPGLPLMTDLGFGVRVIDGSVWRVRPVQKIAHGELAAEWLTSHVLDKVRAEFAAAECRLVRVESGYVHNEAIRDAKARRKLRD